VPYNSWCTRIAHTRAICKFIFFEKIKLRKNIKMKIENQWLFSEVIELKLESLKPLGPVHAFCTFFQKNFSQPFSIFGLFSVVLFLLLQPLNLLLFCSVNNNKNCSEPVRRLISYRHVD